jgi:hypothetical protein
MKKLLALAACLALAGAPLAACTTTDNTLPPTPIASSVNLNVTKAAYASEVAYNIVLKAIVSDVVTGQAAKDLFAKAVDLHSKAVTAASDNNLASLRLLTTSLEALAAPYKAK